ncbi:hypothetical protein D3C77_472260 [compost metagenome]
MIFYPEGLPRGLHSGRTYQTISPLERSQLSSGRSRQRRRFTSVPTMASISWIFNSVQAQTFEAWWRDQLVDGSKWFECPLETPLGYQDYTARFTDIYSGPSRIGPNLWSFSAELELRERPVLDSEWGLFPEFVLDQSIFDFAMNREWPLNPWQTYADAMDLAINEDWPKP